MAIPGQKIIIIGGGMCGIASAIAISQAFASHEVQPQVTVYELRDAPSTFGGPVNLTPKALRCLDKLGVFEELKRMRLGCEVDAIQIFSMRTGSEIASIDYAGANGRGFGGYKGWRVMRFDLLKAMLSVVERLDTVQIRYGKKLTRIEESVDQVSVHFEDGGVDVGELVLGCDGIHSATRNLFVEPDRKPVYSRWAAAYGFVQVKELFGEGEKPFFEDSALVMSRYGSALTTFCDDARSSIYTVLLMEIDEQGSREGWKSIGKDQERVRLEGVRRTQNSPLPKMAQMIEKVGDWTLYPIYVLPPNGRWHTDRVLLLGDAAHAMPPKGESIGHAFEDAIRLSLILSHYKSESPLRAFEFYESFQRKKTEELYKVSSTGWKTNDDIGAIGGRLLEWITPLYLWWTKGFSDKDLWTDPTDISFPT